MAGVAAVEKLGIVDTSRIAVSGWSYGGFMTSWLIGHYHVWKAAVAGASLDDWFDDYNVSFYTFTDVPFFGGLPSDPKFAAMWRSQSPITYATQITTPTLIMGDIGDNNVTITNSFKLYHALKDNGVPVEFVAYPVPGHHPSDPVRNEDINKRWLAWLDKYLEMRRLERAMKTLVIAASFVAALAAAAQADTRTIGLDDFAALVRVSDVAISPDGKQIVYVVSRVDLKENRDPQTLTLFDVASGSQRAISYDRRALSSPAWSPDGSRIAFLANVGTGDDAKQQVFVMDMRGGDPMPMTKAPLGVQQFAWRPDGAALAYVASDEAPNKKDIDAHRDGFVVGDQAFNDMAAPTIARIWTVAADGTGAKQLTTGTFSLPSAQPPSSPGAPISWSPDGREIVFTQMPNAYDADSDLAVVAILDVQTGTVRALTTHGKYEGFGEFSPNGKNVSYWYPFAGDPAAQNDIFVAPVAGGNGADITATEIDSNVQRAIWMNDGTLLIAGHKSTDAALWVKPLGAPARQLDLAGVQPAQTFWLDAGVSRTGAIAFAGTEANHPSELYYLASDTAKPRRLTSYNQATADLNLGKVAPVAWTFEGYSEDGVLTYPPNYDASKTYPLVLIIHGGPKFIVDDGL